MITYQEIEGYPDEQTLAEIGNFYGSIFEKVDAAKFEKRLKEAVNLHIILAISENKIVGFKVGYQIDSAKFYSWIGGVNKNYRKNGIAAELMKRQHLWCAQKGFRTIQTKTRNSFKPMLILNIKNGFDIVEVYRDKQDEIKVVLEKQLA